jgi:hypothetical protein
MNPYQTFLASKLHTAEMSGFTPTLPAWLFDFQAALVDWAMRKGRSAIFADCGLGKTPMQLIWAQNVVERTNRPVLVVTPLAVSSQTLREAEKFSIDAVRSQDGKLSSRAEIVITHYERLEHFDRNQFAGVVCDESSILKNFDGVTKATVTEFVRQMSYRLLCTATAAPNDYIELGTSAEALGEMGYMDMLTRFFKNDGNTIAGWGHQTKWRFKPHAERPFWQWLCSWSRALRKPSDLGFSDAAFALPPLVERVDIVQCSRPTDGKLFVMPAKDLREQRWERRATLTERCEHAAAIHASHARPYVAWCHLNDEGDLLEKLLPDAVQVSGNDADEAKVEKFDAFAKGQVRGLITKPKIGGFGLNWQHCADVTMFPSHSYEQYYQAVRRCWRYGQTRPVTVTLISTEGEADVMSNLQRKTVAADRMFTEMVAAMADATTIRTAPMQSASAPIPDWMGVLAR